jgi:4-alpha-glucanotransferase
VSVRHAGALLPLFSAPSSRSWGLGELPDLVPLSRWLASAGFDRLMLLPIGPVTAGDTSPYSSSSAMALDPIYIALDDVSDFAQAGGERALSEQARADLAAARSATTVQYSPIRRVKDEALSLAFERFLVEEWLEFTTRASQLAGYVSRQRWWLDDFALYRAIANATGVWSWLEWPAPLRDRDRQAIEGARRSLARPMLKEQYLQWIAEQQWQRAKAEARAMGVTLYGDLQFMVSRDGADVWVRPGEVMLDVSLGVPPDQFSDTGQDWGLPTYRWDRIAATGFAWIRQRAQRMAALYDGCRIDHLVGLYRTFGRPVAGEPFFNPSDEPTQTWQGEAILRIYQESGAEIMAEDLGLVPDFVRASLNRLGVPGSKVLRWERHWHAPGQPFIDPRQYPASSAAMTGTHDTVTQAGWWADASPQDREAIAALASETGAGPIDPASPWSASIRDAILWLVYQSGSADIFLPVQDVFGWFDRINIPATVGDHNWTWKLPWTVDRLGDADEPRERAAELRRLAIEQCRSKKTEVGSKSQDGSQK